MNSLEYPNEDNIFFFSELSKSTPRSWSSRSTSTQTSSGRRWGKSSASRCNFTRNLLFSSLSSFRSNKLECFVLGKYFSTSVSGKKLALNSARWKILARGKHWSLFWRRVDNEEWKGLITLTSGEGCGRIQRSRNLPEAPPDIARVSAWRHWSGKLVSLKVDYYYYDCYYCYRHYLYFCCHRQLLKFRRKVEHLMLGNFAQLHIQFISYINAWITITITVVFELCYLSSW
jgi:hypothetical protein